MSYDKSISWWQNECYKLACDKGFHDDGINNSMPTLVANLVGECAELWEEYRKPEFDAKRTYYREKDGKPEGGPPELADIFIRTMDAAGALGIDLEKAVIEKHEFNKSRPFRHGGKRA